MIRFEEITPSEIEVYTTELVPLLLCTSPYKWTLIDDIAKDTDRFIDICQHLVDRGYFQDEDGYVIIDIKEEKFVRLDPMYIRRHNQNFRLWK